MSDLHQLRITAADQSKLEQVSPEFITEGLLQARVKTKQVLQVICAELKEGMNETEARNVALKVFADHGVTKHWHRSYIRFGEGTVMTFHDPLSEQRLQPNDVYHLDLGPVWPSEKLGLGAGLEYEGDCGDTFIFGQNTEAQNMIRVLHEVFDLAKTRWQQQQITGETIYQFMKEQTEARGYKFVEAVEGHRVSDFPHQKYTREGLAKVPFVPSHSLWVLEAMILHPKLQMGAFYEDLML